MRRQTRMAALSIAGLALAACSETAGDSSPPLRTGSSADESACLNAVARETGNTVTVISSDFSQAGTVVTIGVGPQRAPWRCLIARGVVQEVMSLTNEGYL